MDQSAAMSTDDYDEVLALWEKSEGVGLSGADSRESIARYLERNPGLSFVARDDGEIVGAVLCGHDGRRGYLHHLAVAPSHRRQGIGEALTERCLDGLRAIGIGKCHLFIFEENGAGQAFWRSVGWEDRGDIEVVSRTIDATRTSAEGANSYQPGGIAPGAGAVRLRRQH